MEPKHILIFNVNWLGDVLFSTPVIRNIRYNFPNSFIACVIPSRCFQVLEGNPYLDEIIFFDERNQQRSLKEKLKFINLIKAKRFDMAFLLHRSFTRAFILWLAGIKERVGYATKKRAFLLTKKIPHPDRDSLHRIDYYLGVIKGAGLKIIDKHLDFFIGKEDFIFVDNFLKENKITESDLLVGINPFGNWLPKRWPVNYWKELIQKITEQIPSKIIITGAESDLSLAQDIKANNPSVIVACGKLNLKQFGALCKRLNLFISADTGPLHIANTVGTKKIIALFGPTSLITTSPYPIDNVIILKKDVGCKIPCYVVNCNDNRCMKAITPEEVLKEIKRIA
jgi:lipopolysaccharide heptosyltransferase II